MGHGGYGAEHTPNEGIDHLQRRDVDQNSLGSMPYNGSGEIVLQGKRQPIVHVHLNGDQQELTHLQNWDSFHALSCPSARVFFTFHDRVPASPQGNSKSVGEGCLGGDVTEIHTEVNDGLGDLGANATDEAVGPH
jgi:hypothetical protein